MKTACWTLAWLLVCAALGWAAADAPPPSPGLSDQMRDFERNTALGAALTMRHATLAEIEEVRALAARGLEAARDAVADHPDSPEANYLLGSWLLYGYRVVESRIISYSPESGESTGTAYDVALGLSDDPEEGLAALRRTTELAPQRGQYFVDYAAALADCGYTLEARAILKAAWAGQPELTPQERMQAGALLSDADAAQGDLVSARDWLYSALAADPANAEIVEYLRWLDAEQPRAEAAAAAEAEAAAADRAAYAARAAAWAAELQKAAEAVLPEEAAAPPEAPPAEEQQ